MTLAISIHTAYASGDHSKRTKYKNLSISIHTAYASGDLMVLVKEILVIFQSTPHTQAVTKAMAEQWAGEIFQSTPHTQAVTKV